MSQLTTSSQGLAFLETNLAGDINVKEMDFTVGGNEFSFRVVDRAGVVDFFISWVAFWDRASDQVCLGILFKMVPVKNSLAKCKLAVNWQEKGGTLFSIDGGVVAPS